MGVGGPGGRWVGERGKEGRREWLNEFSNQLIKAEKHGGKGVTVPPPHLLVPSIRSVAYGHTGRPPVLIPCVPLNSGPAPMLCACFT